MAKTEATTKQNAEKSKRVHFETEDQNKEDQNKEVQRKEDKNEENQKKDGDKKKVEYKPGISYLYDPCPHRVWTPKPGERSKSAPRGMGSPWYEPVKKKADADKEEEEKRQKKEEKSQKKRRQAYEKKQQKQKEEEKKKKAEEKEKKEKDEKKQQEKEMKEKERKKKERKERKEQEEKRTEEREKKRQEEEENKKQGASKGKEKPHASYMYEPCPHRVYTPAPGEKDMADPKGVGSPWYEPVRKKEDIDKDNETRQQEENKKIMADAKKRQKEREKEEQRQAEKRKKEEERWRKREEARSRRRQEMREKRKLEEEQKEMECEEMGCGVRESRTDFTPELTWMMDFIAGVDNQERERRGEALQWKKEELEEEAESHLAKEAYMRDFKELISTLIETEWIRADKKLAKLDRDEKRRRKKMLEDMDPLAKDLMEEGNKTMRLYQAAMKQGGRRSKGRRNDLEVGWGEGPSPKEDALVSQVMRQMDLLAGRVVR